MGRVLDPSLIPWLGYLVQLPEWIETGWTTLESLICVVVEGMQLGVVLLVALERSGPGVWAAVVLLGCFVAARLKPEPVADATSPL